MITLPSRIEILSVKCFQVKYRSNVPIKESVGEIKHFIQQHNKLSDINEICIFLEK